MRHFTSAPSRFAIDTLRLDRRALLLGATATAATLVFPARALARQATPSASPAAHEHGMGDATIPALDLVRTADGIAFPATVTAGLNRITMHNDADGIFHAFSMRVPDGMSDDAVLAALSQEDPGDWFATTLFTGSPDEAPANGGTTAGVVDYLPGRYVFLNVFEGTSAFFDVTGDAWGRSAPVAGREIGLQEYAYLGLDAPVPAGKQVWRLTNHGTMWHDMTLFTAPAGATAGDMLDAVMAGGDAFPPEGYEISGGCGAMSPGYSIWIELDLAPGTHIAACFLPGDDGTPHAFQGMVAAFEAG